MAWPCRFWGGTVCQHSTCRPDPVAVARRGDPGTSHEAAASVQRIRDTQAQVLAMFSCNQLTDEELVDMAARLGMRQSVSGLRTRRKELVDMGYLVDTGQRKRTKAGRRTIVWGTP